LGYGWAWYALGVDVNRIVLGEVIRKKRHPYIQPPENCEWVLIIETIGTTGDYIYLLVMFKGKNPGV
jgi:hypothetical protein